MDIEKMKEYCKYLEERRHSQRVINQREDQAFFEDKYDMPLIKDPRYQIRTGYVAGMCNDITYKVIGDKPKVYTKPRKQDIEYIKLGAERIASEANRWMMANRKIPAELFKKLFVRGDAWLYIVHDEDLVKYSGNWKADFPEAVPVMFIPYDPMIVFAEPNDEVYGSPPNVIVHYRRRAGEILEKYPEWSKGKSLGETEMADFYLQFDRESSFACADDEALFRNPAGLLLGGDGHRPNPYKLVPFVHGYTGWGIESADRDPALLTYSMIRMIKGIITETSTMHSDIAYNVHDFAHSRKLVILKNGEALGADAFSNYKKAPDSISTLALPDGAEWKDDAPIMLGPQVFAHLGLMESKLNQIYPLSMRGVASGSSGRQEDVLIDTGLTMYDAPLSSLNEMWERALDIGFNICASVDMMPKGLSKEDIDTYSEIKVDVQRDNPLELNRAASAALTKWERGFISHEDAFMEMGETQEEAKKKAARAWVDQVKRNNPAIVQMIVQIMSQELGQEEQMAQIQQELQGAITGANPLINYGARGGEQRNQNIKTNLGSEMADMSELRPQRNLPV